jgi:hypothetical protein
LEWVAEDVVAAGGTAAVWIARPASESAERELAQQLADARAAEYAAVISEAAAGAELAGSARASALRRLRNELRRIHRRDFFPPAERDAAQAAVRELAASPAPAEGTR